MQYIGNGSVHSIADDNQQPASVRIKLKTSVTGDELEIQFEKVYRRNNLPNIGSSEDTHICGDRASENVKAGEQISNTFVSGILHDFNTWIGGDVKKVTSEFVRKRGQRIKTPNPHFQPQIKNSMDQSKSFTIKIIK